MKEKILFSSYTIRLKDISGNYQLLSSIDGGPDFIDIFKDFTNEIFENINSSADSSLGHSTHLTLENPAVFDNNDSRRLYGFFSSGVSGERYKVIDTKTSIEEMNVEPHHAAFRNIFFYLYVPRMKNTAFLILQRKAQFGIKLRLRRSLNEYIKTKGYNRTRLELNNIMHNKVYKKMMHNGNLKKVELIKRKIPRSIEKYLNNGEELEEIKGTFKSSFTSRTSLPNSWKEYIDKLFRQSNDENGTIELNYLENEYDDLEFELELNGKRKTFFIINQHKIQPDVDVTANIEFDNEEPTTESLVAQAREQIQDVSEILPQ